jgi:hypothetical protein
VSNRLAMLAAVLVLVVVASAPALAQSEAPLCEFDSACLDSSEEQGAPADQYTGSPEPGQVPSVPPTPEFPSEGSNDDQYPLNAQSSVPEAALTAPASCGSCGLQVAQSAQDAITGDEPGGTDPAATFGAVLQAVRDAGVTRKAAASEEPETSVEKTAVYNAAFEAAKEAGADDETAKEAAEQAVAEADSGRAIRGKDPEEGASEDEAREDMPNGEDVPASDEEDGASDSPGSGSGETVSTPTGSQAPLLLGRIAFLSVGGFAALRFTRSWSTSDLTKLPRN